MSKKKAGMRTTLPGDWNGETTEVREARLALEAAQARVKVLEAAIRTYLHAHRDAQARVAEPHDQVAVIVWAAKRAREAALEGLPKGAAFEPDWVSPPGETIREMLDAQGLSSRFLRSAHVQEPDALLRGGTRIDAKIARWLTTHLGGTLGFWLERDEDYVEDCARLGLMPGEHTMTAGASKDDLCVCGHERSSHVGGMECVGAAVCARFNDARKPRLKTRLPRKKGKKA